MMEEKLAELQLTIYVSIDGLTPTDTGCYYYLLQHAPSDQCLSVQVSHTLNGTLTPCLTNK